MISIKWFVAAAAVAMLSGMAAGQSMAGMKMPAKPAAKPKPKPKPGTVAKHKKPVRRAMLQRRPPPHRNRCGRKPCRGWTCRARKRRPSRLPQWQVAGGLESGFRFSAATMRCEHWSGERDSEITLSASACA